METGLTTSVGSGGAGGSGSKCSRGVVICAFVASTGFFHGYDNGVVNGVFEMPAFREHMGWPPVTVDCTHMSCNITTTTDTGAVSRLTLRSGDPNPRAQTSVVALHQGLTVNGFNGGAALSALLFGHFLVDSRGRRPALILVRVLDQLAPSSGLTCLHLAMRTSVHACDKWACVHRARCSSRSAALCRRSLPRPRGSSSAASLREWGAG
jgi:hypothetical protein